MEEAVGKAQSRLAPRTPVPVGVDPAVPRIHTLEPTRTPGDVPRPLPSESPKTRYNMCEICHCAVQLSPAAKPGFGDSESSFKSLRNCSL
jgi:hypothetical protein